jgi:Rad54 N terminal
MDSHRSKLFTRLLRINANQPAIRTEVLNIRHVAVSRGKASSSRLPRLYGLLRRVWLNHLRVVFNYRFFTTQHNTTMSAVYTCAKSDRVIRPFKCPGSASAARNDDRPTRKRRKISYADADASVEDGDRPYSNDDRLALATRDINRFPVFKAKDKDSVFKARFSVPLLNREKVGYDAYRPAPLLGMRQGRVFVAKPLHDPSGEFAIVLYDPTVDEPPSSSQEAPKAPVEEPEKLKLDVPLVHKSLADILGIKKTVEKQPRVPVVIDPRLAKVLRPHQIEGVKVSILKSRLYSY